MGVRIYQLPTVVANQIAAGEVIERPASVVKELLENALDAGATSISIDIGFGGLNQIKVSDNGIGIVADDLLLAVAAHATSKITQLNDLYAITSMGFRGEALASIASISHLSLYSKPAHQAHGMMLKMADDAWQIEPFARAQGTTVDMRDLFYNAPVRKKFLKSERSEYLAIEAVVKRFALSAPHVGLTLKHNDKQTLVLAPALCQSSQLLRIKKLLGKVFVEQAIDLDVVHDGVHLQGWISGLHDQRSQQDKQWIYINQRMVKDKLLNHALKQAYGSILHPGRHPACVLYLTLPADQVDVNVHPTKHEVRFQQPRLIHDLMTSEITQALSKPVGWALAQQDNALKVIVEPMLNLRGSNAVCEPSSAYRPWVILNQDYAIVFFEQEPWLIDIHQLHRHRIHDSIINQVYPWPSRPLLVPVNITIDKSNYSHIEQLSSLYAQVGIVYDFTSQTRILVRTIPQRLPLTDIKRLFEPVINNLPDLIQHLMNCQSFDVRQLSIDEKIELTAFMQQNMQWRKSMGKCLDPAACRGFLYA